MSYAWIIDKDHINDGEDNGLVGNRNAPDSIVSALKDNPEAGAAFKLYDDNGELYYEGRILGSGIDHGMNGVLINCTDQGFRPLDDYGALNAGCTRIDYKNKSGQWETL